MTHPLFRLATWGAAILVAGSGPYPAVMHPLFRLATWGAYVAALAGLLQLAIAVFPAALGVDPGVWGAFYGIQFVVHLALVPVALALHQVYRGQESMLKEALTALGLAGMARHAFVLAPLALGLISYMQEEDSRQFAMLAVGAWMVLASALGIGRGVPPRPLCWLGIATGALYLVAVWYRFQWVGVWRDPANEALAADLARKGVLSFAALYIVFPIWAAGLGLWLQLRGATLEAGQPSWRLALEPFLGLLLVVPLLTEQPKVLPGFDATQFVGQFDEYDCADFASQAEAQAVLRTDPSDPNRLEGGRPGIACPRNQSPLDPVPVRKQLREIEPLYGELRGHGALYFVPLDGFPRERVEALATYYRERFNLEIPILSGLPLLDTATNRWRDQLIAQEVQRSMKAAFPTLSGDSTTALIGFVEADMYISGTAWGWAFAHTADSRTTAVISTARLGLDEQGRPATDDLLQQRLRKATMRYIGMIHFRIPRNNDPASLFYVTIGVRELDRVRDDLRTE